MFSNERLIFFLLDFNQACVVRYTLSNIKGILMMGVSFSKYLHTHATNGVFDVTKTAAQFSSLFDTLPLRNKEIAEIAKTSFCKALFFFSEYPGISFFIALLNAFSSMYLCLLLPFVELLIYSGRSTTSIPCACSLESKVSLRTISSGIDKFLSSSPARVLLVYLLSCLFFIYAVKMSTTS